MIVRIRLVSVLIILMSSTFVYAENKSNGIIGALIGKEASNWIGLENHGITIGGWMTGGINYNSANTPEGSNGPVSMTDRNGSVNLYQTDLFIEKAVNKGSSWDIGGRFDYMFGTDTRYTQASGNWDSYSLSKNSYYNMAIPQAYAEIFAPLAQGLSVKVGHFYTIMGYESVASAPNFFSSHTYSFKSSPFTTTGALFNIALNDEWGFNAGAVTGADNFNRDIGAWSQMSGLTWTHSKTGTSASLSVLSGDVYSTYPSQLMYYTAIFQQALGKWHYILQHDLGAQQNAVAQGQNADWYSIVQYMLYQATDEWGVGVRGEWFRDTNGVRYTYGKANYYAMTGGLNWKPKRWLMIRPEVRYDWSQAKIAPFDGGQRTGQFLMCVDAVIQF